MSLRRRSSSGLSGVRRAIAELREHINDWRRCQYVADDDTGLCASDADVVTIVEMNGLKIEVWLCQEHDAALQSANAEDSQTVTDTQEEREPKNDV